VAGKLSSAGGLNATGYLHRLSEIQVQDEAYIYERLVEPEDCERQLDRLSKGL